MERIRHAFTTREAWLALRKRNLNSTEISALFGLSPYMTALELALTKAGKIDEVDVDNTRTNWGTRLQDAIAAGVAEEFGVIISRLDGYSELDKLKIGSSFDFEIVGSLALMNADTGLPQHELTELQKFFHEHGPGMLEIKNVDGRVFANDWAWVDGQLEAAPHIEIQLQHQLLVSGLKWGAIAVLVGGNTLKILIRLADPYFAGRILEVAAKFWSDLAKGLFPPAMLPQDADVIARLFNFAEPGSFYDGTGDDLLRMACERYNVAGAEIAKLVDAKDTHKAEILQILQTHEKGVAPGYKISTWNVAPSRQEAFDKPGFRGFRVTKIKVKGSN